MRKAPTEDRRGRNFPKRWPRGHRHDRSDDQWDNLPDEATALVLAGRWSLDPTTIEDRFTEVSAGWIGDQRPGSCCWGSFGIAADDSPTTQGGVGGRFWLRPGVALEGVRR